MPRVLLALVVLAAIAGSSSAEDTKKIAVLGLEVVGTVDVEGTTIAHNLTEQLRAQVRTSARYVIAPNSTKELIDEKLANSCDSEAMACMTAIAKKFRAKWMLFGRVAKKNSDGPGYLVSLKLLDVDRKTITPWSDFIPQDDVGSDLDVWAKKGFAMITGQDETSPVAVTAPLKDPPHRDDHNRWRTPAYIAVGGTLVMAGGFFYSWNRLSGLGKKSGFLSYGELCRPDKTTPNGFTDASPGDCTHGGGLQKATYATGLGMAVVGTFAIVAVYKGFVAKRARHDADTLGKAPRKARFAVAPIVSPDAAGAMMQLDW